MAAQREERAGAAELFERSRFSESLAAYSTTEDGGHDAPSKAVYTACNRAAAKLGLEMFRACIRDVDDAIKIDPFCLRAYILKETQPQEMTDGSGDVSSTIAFGMAQDAVRHQQQQPERLAMPPQQQQHQKQQQQHQHQQPHQHQHHPTPARETYKSCDFCAKRKIKCSGDLPRCSLCIEKKQPYCHYQLKPPTKSRATKPAAARSRSSSSSFTSSGGVGAASQLAGAADDAVHSSGGVVPAVPGNWSLAMVPGSISMKRCRLSASPATGLVGMQENGFLGDFFGCLGVLPLATESTVRNAMVEIMNGAVPPPQQYQHKGEYFGNGELGMGGEAHKGEGAGTGLAEGEEEGWGGTLVCRDVSGYSAKCVMWCAIALGALMRGSPVEYVAGYIRLARDSLAECFDGNNIETARAYLMMSFLHGIIRDEEKCRHFLSFAMSIVSGLGPDEVPKELEAMLLTVEKMSVFENAGNPTEMDDLSAFCKHVVDLPPVGDVMQQKDVCNMFLVADRRANQAFFTDMFSPGAFVHAKEELKQEGNDEPVKGEFLEQPGGAGMAGSRDEKAWGKGPQLSVWDDPRLVNSGRNGPKPALAGTARKDFVQEALPELLRLSKTMKTSEAGSGVGGLLYHGSVAYMQAVKGDLADVFESMEACAKVLIRYPGTVRVRPHGVHCILSGSHDSGRQDIYDAMREVYNPNRPLGFAPAPPFEEWTGMSQLCGHVYCRSVKAEIEDLPTVKHPLDPTAAADRRQADESSSLRSSSSAGFDSSRSGAGAHSSGSPLVGSAQGNVQQPVNPAAAATDVCADVGGQSAAPGQQASALGVPVPVGDPAPKLELFEGEPASEQGEVHLTDADLLDAAAVSIKEEGPLVEGRVKEELL